MSPGESWAGCPPNPGYALGKGGVITDLYSCLCKFRVSSSCMRKILQECSFVRVIREIVKLSSLTECSLGQGGSDPSFVHKNWLYLINLERLVL